VTSEQLDYRSAKDTKLEPLATPEDLKDKYMKLTDHMSLQWAAADFKTDSKGQLSLLEVNSGPMFTGFDRACEGQLTKAMIRYLIG
jgi:D-alanine-D-alanine ligase-like ATP-grasp enzyme